MPDRPLRTLPRLAALVVLAAGVLVGGAATSLGQVAGGTVRVPADQATIQAGADAAGAGGLVLVDAGTYLEQVELTEDHDGITIRGVDRNEVVLDGQGRLATAVMVRGADGVRLENLTAHDYTAHGFSWQSVDGWVGRYLTAYRIGVYGIYAFDSRMGLLEHSYSSGASDAAIYIGQCSPCDATVRNVVAEHATMGYSGTNASGNIVVEDSQWNRNGAGIVPNSLDSEALPPQRTAIFRRNVVQDSGQAPVPSRLGAETLGGIGILVAGGIDDVVEDNLVTGSRRIGIAVGPQPSRTVWHAAGNVVRRNIVRDTEPGGVDLAIQAKDGSGNCFVQNQFTTSDPPAIEQEWACGDGRAPQAENTAARRDIVLLPGTCQDDPSGCGGTPTTWDRTPVPPPQPTMPEGEAGQGNPGGPQERPGVTSTPVAAPNPAVVAPPSPTSGQDVTDVSTGGDASATPLSVAFALGVGVTGLWWMARMRWRAAQDTPTASGEDQ